MERRRCLSIVVLLFFEFLVNIAAEENYISKDDIKKVLKFQSNPSDPSWMDE